MKLYLIYFCINEMALRAPLIKDYDLHNVGVLSTQTEEMDAISRFYGLNC